MKQVSLRVLLAFALICVTCTNRVYGQNGSVSNLKPANYDYRPAMMHDIDDVGRKLLDLAQATPPDKFSWHPNGEGFLSVSELYLQAAAQYFHKPRVWGGIKAAGYEYEGDATTAKKNPPDLDKSTTDKSQVILELTDATSYFDGIMKTLSDADMQKTIKVNGHETTPYADLRDMAVDVHEYLARASDYARINGVILPWMDERQKEMRQSGLRTPRNP